jgi:hypothetical protein
MVQVQRWLHLLRMQLCIHGTVLDTLPSVATAELAACGGGAGGVHFGWPLQVCESLPHDLVSAVTAREGREQRFESRGHVLIDSPKVGNWHVGVRHRVHVGRRPKLRLRVHCVSPSLHLCRKNLRPPPAHGRHISISTLISSASLALCMCLPLVRSHFVCPSCVGRIRHLRPLPVGDTCVQQVGVLRNLRANEQQ